MKANEVLEWICKYDINGKDLRMVDVPEEGENEWEQNEEWWYNEIGNTPACSIPSGRYLYYYESDMETYDMYDERGAYVEPDAMIEMPVEHGFDYVYFYRIEE